MFPYKIEFEKIDWESPMNGLRFKVFRKNNKQLRLVEYTQEMEHHWCEKGHIGFVLEGQFEIEFTNETFIYNPGDGIFIPDGPEHKHMGKPLTKIVKVVFVEEV